MTQSDLTALTTEIIRLAWTDRGFLQALLGDARAAIAAHFGLELPHGVELHVMEETATTWYLVLPVDGAEVSALRSPLEAQIVAAAQAKADLRHAMLVEPRSTLAGEFGLALPPELEVIVLAESATQRYLVLPIDPLADERDADLSHEDLLAVVGGGRTFRPGCSPPGGGSGGGGLNRPGWIRPPLACAGGIPAAKLYSFWRRRSRAC